MDGRKMHYWLAPLIFLFLFTSGVAAAATINVPGDHATIQAAIDSATTGDIINVAAGTYIEDVTITTDGIELVGAGSSSTIIRGIANVPKASWPLGVPNIDLRADNVKIHGFKIQGPAYVADKYVSGIILDGLNIEIYDNYFDTTRADTTDELAHAITTVRTTAIPTADCSGLNIHNNTFAGTGTVGVESIYINPHTGTGTITITNNEFLGSTYVGITAETGKITVSNNTINTSIAGLYGMRFMDTTYAGNFQNISLSGNTIQSFQYGVRVGNGGAGASAFAANISSNTMTNNTVAIWTRNGSNVTASSNSIVGATGVRNDIATLVVAENNWWGSSLGPTHATNPTGTGAAVTNNVDFTPWTTRPPVANAQSVTASEDVPKSITLTGSNPSGKPLTYSIVTQPSNGTLSGTPPNVTYTPKLNWFGSDSFTFKVNDTELDSSAATVSITVNSVNDPPVVGSSNMTGRENELFLYSPSITDVEGDAITVTASVLPQGALYGSNGVSTAVSPNYETWMRWTPDYTQGDSSFGGKQYVITFTAVDANSGSGSGTLTVGILDTPEPTATSTPTATDTPLPTNTPTLTDSDRHSATHGHAHGDPDRDGYPHGNRDTNGYRYADGHAHGDTNTDRYPVADADTCSGAIRCPGEHQQGTGK